MERVVNRGKLGLVGAATIALAFAGAWACSSEDAADGAGGAGGAGGTSNPDAGSPGGDAAPGGGGGAPDQDASTDASVDTGGSTVTPDASVLDGGAPCAPMFGEDVEWPTSPTQLMQGNAEPMGVTSHGWLLYDHSGLLSATRPDGSETVDISSESGNLAIDGRVAFYFIDADYEIGVGDMIIWSGGTCARHVDDTLFAAGMTAASDDGEHVLFASNVTESQFDLVAATRDLAEHQVLIAGVGRGNEQTCGSHYGFAGNRIIVGSCEPGSRDATLRVFDREAEAWSATEVDTELYPDWSASASGQRIFYRSTVLEGRLWDDGSSIVIDEEVGSAVVLPDGSALLYTVGDQLRRTELPSVVPMPLIINGFREIAGFSPTYDRVLFSDAVEYEGGERRDLFLTGTDELNTNPMAVVDSPAARLARSVFTDDGQYVMYLRDVDEEGLGTLEVVPVSGAEGFAFDGVDTAQAAAASWVLFTDNRSEPGTYPETADLKRVDAAGDGSPELIVSGIVGGDGFVLTPGGEAVLYGIPADANNPDAEGVWLQPL
ncbi:MAG: hypothetical protein ACOC1F_03780 [Myxococcota bacterium]